jgi:threonine/homoserine/homoserine lactone efflux protein
MFDIQNYSSFILAVLLFQLYPGAGTIAIFNATARGGVRGGMKAVFGTLTGDFIYMLSAVLGLAAIFTAYPSILNIAQWIGAIYLIWIGLKFIRVPTNEFKNIEIEKNNWEFYRQAFTVSLTNPKAIVFFMAFFPLFLGVGSRPLTLIILMAHVTVISFLYQTGLVFIGNVSIQHLSNFRYVRIIAARLAGVAFISFGVKLILNKR